MCAKLDEIHTYSYTQQFTKINCVIPTFAS